MSPLQPPPGLGSARTVLPRWGKPRRRPCIKGVGAWRAVVPSFMGDGREPAGAGDVGKGRAWPVMSLQPPQPWDCCGVGGVSEGSHPPAVNRAAFQQLPGQQRGPGGEHSAPCSPPAQHPAPGHRLPSPWQPEQRAVPSGDGPPGPLAPCPRAAPQVSWGEGGGRILSPCC